jgi:hypothetical protein
VDVKRCEAALAGGSLATDEVMRRVEAGRPFRSAYREVAAALKQGESFEPPAKNVIISRRGSAGGLGNLGLPGQRTRIRRARAWNTGERRRFQQAIRKLAGGTVSPSARPSVRPS